MSLSFLAPLFLAGLAAVAIPILVHLRRERERSEVPFPSLRFLRDTPVRTERRRRIRNPWLLALRTAVLCLLAAAFARPFLAGESEAATGVVGPREVVVLVDRSWSMSAPGRWTEAADEVRRVADGLGPRDRASLVLFDHGARAPVRSTADGGLLVRELSRAGPGDGGTRIGPALRLAGSLLEASSLANREVVLVSDFGAGAGTEEVRLPPGVELRTVAVDAGVPDDVAVLDAGLARDGSAGDGVRVRARLLARGGAGGPAEVILEAGGSEWERRRVELEPGTPTEVTFGPLPSSAGRTPVTVRVAGDDLPADDAYHLVLDGSRSVSVLVLRRAGADDTSLYLRRALELSREPPMEVAVESPARIRPAHLAGHRVVVLDDRIPSPGPETAALRDFVEAGGGLLVATGPGVSPATEREELDLLPARPGPVTDRDAGARLATVDRDHPIFEPFRERGVGSLTGARFLRTRRLAAGDSAHVLARFDDGSAALVEGRVGSGRVLVWASTLDTYWSDLPVQPAFLPFLQRAALHLASLDETPASYGVGDAVAVGESEPVIVERAGIHALPDGEGREIPVAVNAPRDEALDAAIDPEELAAAVTRPGDEGAPGARRAVTPLDRERSQGFWRFLVAGAVLLLAVETVAANRLSGAKRPT